MTITTTQSVMLEDVSFSGFEPMQAASMFANEFSQTKHLQTAVRVKVELHGRFAAMGLKDLVGSTVIAGLQNDQQQPQQALADAVARKRLNLAGSKEIYFDAATDLKMVEQELPTASNGITITVKNVDAEILMQRSYWLAH